MALPYVPKDEEEIENKEGSSLGVESGLAGVSKSVSGQQLGSGQYTNLQKYLDSNKGFGSDLAGKVDQVVGGAEQAQSDLQSRYKSDADKNSVKLDQENIDFVTSNPYAAQQGYGKEDLAKTTSGSQLQKIGEPKEFQKFFAQRDAEYKGPNQSNSETYFADPRNQTRNAQQIGSMLGSESGKKQLLNKFYGNGKQTYGYTPGQQNLDLLLVSQDPNAKQSFIQSQQRASQLDPKFQNLITELSSYGKQKEDETATARKTARNAIGIDDYGSFTGSGPIQNILNEIQKQKADALTKYQAEVPQVSQALKNKDISSLTDQQKNTLNLQDIYSLYKVDPEKFLKIADINNLSDSSVASQDQLNNINALSELANLQQSWIDSSKIGSFDSSVPFTYDKQGLLSEINKNRQNYINARKQMSAPLTYNSNSGAPSFNKTKYADIDDIIGMLQQKAFAFTNSSNAPQNLATKPSGTFSGPTSYYDIDNNMYDARVWADQLDWYKKLLFGPTGIDDQYGRTDVLKAGRKNEIGELPDVIKNDIMEGWRTNKPFMYGSNNQDLSGFDTTQSQQLNGFTNKTSSGMPSSSAGSYDYNSFFASPDQMTKFYAPKQAGGYQSMPWDEYFNLYSQGKFY